MELEDRYGVYNSLSTLRVIEVILEVTLPGLRVPKKNESVALTFKNSPWQNGHKLIPSVIAGIEIGREGLGKPDFVGYSGPTYTAIRSGKHSFSTALVHGLDFNRLLDLHQFYSITKTGSEKYVKPVVIFTVDGGPHENPRYRKVIADAIHQFFTHNFDALFVATNSPGRSAYNQLEKLLTLDWNRKILDLPGVLSDVWSDVKIYGFPTVAEYIDPAKSELNLQHLKSKDQKWFAEHFRTSQYFTQIVKCQEPSCFLATRSSYFSIFPSRFLPSPIPLYQTLDGLKAPERVDFDSHKFPSLFVYYQNLNRDVLPRSTRGLAVLPYDFYCSSVQSQLLERMCKVCSLYFASKVMLKSHLVIHKADPPVNVSTRITPIRVATRRQREMMAIIALNENGPEQADWIDVDDLDLQGIPVLLEISDEEPSILPFCSIEEHLSLPWEEE
ncbi:hypothetical protein DAPPUDRAFT_105121 [Daphnia pulex]|uniref:C2H2-type domain-containing protein n=1 Tax=Daphnia pulex TaxID=6669 RepID=E9GPJ6_DAPPU|nr:hypothetical protein DAPPUDRAFT_105121 [Daphnia pulex]|eukprot:EFX78649.1 hypothetical protein DAPPUDRAFT_105121 [Daphnia pulex]